MTMMRRNKTHDTVQRRKRFFARVAVVVGGACTVGLMVAFFFGEMGLAKYLHMKDLERGLEQDIQDIERTNTELKTEIRRVQQDPARLEELARERLGFVRPGETVYQVMREPARNATGKP